MSKLPAWLAIAAVSFGLSAAGCRRSVTSEEKDTSGKPPPTYNPGGSATTPGGSGAGSAEAGSAQAEHETPLKPGELPPECNEYSVAMDKLTKCESIPATVRDALKQTYETTQKSWAGMTPESKATIAKACKAAADSVVAASAGCK